MSVTLEEIAQFEMRVMSVGHGVLTDMEWRRLVDTIAAWRPVVEAAIAVSDADLSVYDDVPEAHDLMNQLDRAVDQLRTPSTDQETP